MRKKEEYWLLCGCFYTMDMKLQFSRRFKITCGTTVLIGLAAHLFALTNVLKTTTILL